MNTIDEMITVLKAFKEGKTIEFRRMEGIGDTKWREIARPIWEWHVMNTELSLNQSMCLMIR